MPTGRKILLSSTSRMNPSILQIRQVVTRKDAGGNVTQSPTERRCEAPRVSGNISRSERRINFFLHDQLTLTAYEGTIDGITTAVQTYVTYYLDGKLIFGDREVEIVPFDMGDQAKEGIFAYTAKW